LIQPLLEARAKIQKYFRSLFGSNENFRICFPDLLTFNRMPFTAWKQEERNRHREIKTYLLFLQEVS
jgi:hypothetical protein